MLISLFIYFMYSSINFYLFIFIVLQVFFHSSICFNTQTFIQPFSHFGHFHFPLLYSCINTGHSNANTKKNINAFYAENTILDNSFTCRLPYFSYQIIVKVVHNGLNTLLY